MANTIYDQYLENEILHADPMQLVGILYRAAIDSVDTARGHLQKGAIRERSRSISRASDILNHLMLGLDHSAGSEISRNLAELYVYMLSRLVEANVNQTDAPLAEVEQLLNTLCSAWQEAAKACVSVAPPPAVTGGGDIAVEYSFESLSY